MGTWGDGPGVVELPSGRKVRGRGLRRPTTDGVLPEYGVYLVASPPQGLPWEHAWVRCPDFRTPTDTAQAITILRGTYERTSEQRVEVGCGGGIGRSGLALAVLAVIDGVDPADAVRWVREHYHPRAVETPWQRRWVRRLEVSAAR